MDPLSITSGIIGLAAIAGKITRALLDLKKVLQSTEAAEELHCYTLLLSELSDLVLKNAVAPPSAFAAAGLCQERLSVLQHAVSARKPDAKAIRAELSSLQASIMLLRQMVMESVIHSHDDSRRSSKLTLLCSSTTHTLLQEQREAQVRVMESNISRRAKHEGIIEVNIDPGALAGEDAAKRLQQLLSVYSNPDIDREGILTINVTRNPQEHEDGSERETDLDQLRSQLHKMNLQVQAGKNPFQRAIHVLHADSAQGHLLLIAKIDTASRKNWVRTQVIQQLALEHQVEQLEASVSDWFKGAGGELFQASGRVILTWYDSIVARTRETEFLISCEDAPFDLIFGWEWLTADGESAFAEPFLAIMKEINLSEG